jgi:hypothetical protein
MKNIIVGIAIWLLFCNGHCSSVAKETPNCHPYLRIQNNSRDSLIIGIKWEYNDSCTLNEYGAISPSSFIELEGWGGDCWEHNIINGTVTEIYVLPLRGNGNLNKRFKPCNLLDSNFTILKHFILNVDSLRETNFIITYP